MSLSVNFEHWKGIFPGLGNRLLASHFDDLESLSESFGHRFQECLLGHVGWFGNLEDVVELLSVALYWIASISVGKLKAAVSQRGLFFVSFPLLLFEAFDR